MEFYQRCKEEDLALLNSVADQIGVSSSCLSRWIKKLPIYEFIVENDKTERDRFSLSAGRRGQLEDISSGLLSFVEDLREKGYAVSRKMIVTHACRLLGSDTSFPCKSYAAKAQSISRWMAKNNLSIRLGTHQAQALPQSVESCALDFMINIARPAVSPNLSYRHPDFIINMDQTPVEFSIHQTRCVNRVGMRSINIRIAKNANQRATVAVGFTAGGTQLKSLVIFKGKHF